MNPYPDQIYGGATLTFADYVHGVRHEPRMRRLLVTATPIGVATLAGAAWLIQAGYLLVGTLVGLLGLLAFAAWNLPEIIAKRWFDKTNVQTRQFKYTLAAQGLIVASAGSNALYEYEGISGFCECPEAFLVWLTDARFLIIPKRAFDVGDLPRVRETFSSKLEERR